MKVDGITLLQMIKNKEIKENTKIKVHYLDIPTKHILEVTSNNLIWQPGEFMAGELWDKDYTFEILEEKSKEAKRIETENGKIIFGSIEDELEFPNRDLKLLANYIEAVIIASNENANIIDYLLKKEDE